jgi:hypothetical protein
MTVHDFVIRFTIAMLLPLRQSNKVDRVVVDLISPTINSKYVRVKMRWTVHGLVARKSRPARNTADQWEVPRGYKPLHNSFMSIACRRM